MRKANRYLGVAQLGSVLEWGSRGRRFKSSHPDQNNKARREGASYYFALREMVCLVLLEPQGVKGAEPSAASGRRSEAKAQ
jgi:hypothetical protein